MAETILDRNYQRAVADVRAKVSGYATRMWAGLGSYRDADAERLIDALVPRVEAGQKRVADLTDAYISRVVADQLGESIVRGEVADSSTLALRGVEAEEVYERPFTTVYTKLSENKTLDAALSAGAARLVDLVLTGTQLAKTHSAKQAMGRTGINLYQRVLTGNENCALCVIASTQRYFKSKLLPIHPGCDCYVKPFVGNPDEQVIAPKMLEETQALIQAKYGQSDRGARDIGLDNPVSDYLDLIVTHEHGEIGPLLGYRGDHFSPGDSVR